MIESGYNYEGEGYFTTDGWFFLGDKYCQDFSQAMGHCVVSSTHASEWVEAAVHITELCRRRGVPCIFLIAPAKWSVYREKLRDFPDYRPNQESILDKVVRAAKPTSLDLIDLRREMIAGRSCADTYSPRDSHWNGYGALLAWRTLVDRLTTHFPSETFFDPGSVASIETTDDWNEATTLTGVPGENRFSYPVFSEQFLDFDMRYTDGVWCPQKGARLVSVGELPVNTRNNLSSSKLRALILRDSVGDLLSPYLHSTFAETYQRVHHVNVEGRTPSVSALLRDYAPDVLIFLVTERYLVHPFFDVEMARTCSAFEAQPSVDARWPFCRSSSELLVEGWENPQNPVLIRLPPSPNNEKLLKVSIYTAGVGALLASYTIRGEIVQKHFIYRAGASDFYLAIHGNPDGDHLWILDQHNSERTFIREIAISYRPLD